MGFNRTALRATQPKLDVLRPGFEDRIISRCDLIQLDYYLWGAVKDKHYTDKPETIDAAV